MANIIKCINGHFFDLEKHSECPYCNKKEQDNLLLSRRYSADLDIPGSEDVTVPLMKEDAQQIVNFNNPRSVKGIEADSDVTVPVFLAQNPKEKAVYRNTYVTGWLVCIKGEMKGRDYRIKHSRNWVGRKSNMDIWIDGGTGIAYDRHCEIIYDGKSNRFYIMEGEGAFTYVNGKLLNGNMELHIGDIIDIGECSFEFIPFCREGRVWS